MNPCFSSACQIAASVKPEPYVAPADTPQPRTHEIGAKPVAPPVSTEGASAFVQPDTEAKPQTHDGAKPVYLRLVGQLMGDEDPPPPYQIYIPSGSNSTDPTAVLSPPLCPVDSSKMHFIGSTRLAWVCEAYSHQFDVVGGMASVPAIYVADDKLHPALPNALPSL